MAKFNDKFSGINTQERRSQIEGDVKLLLEYVEYASQFKGDVAEFLVKLAQDPKVPRSLKMEALKLAENHSMAPATQWSISEAAGLKHG